MQLISCYMAPVASLIVLFSAVTLSSQAPLVRAGSFGQLRPASLGDTRGYIESRRPCIGLIALDGGPSESIVEAIDLREMGRLKRLLSPVNIALLSNEERAQILVASARWMPALKIVVRSGIDVNSRYESGRTVGHFLTDPAFDIGSWERRKPSLQILLRSGLEVNTVDHQGESMLHNATRWAQDGPTELLVEQGAKAMAREGDQWTPLMSLAASGDRGFSRSLRLLRLLLSAGESLVAKSKGGETALELCRIYGNKGMCQAIAWHIRQKHPQR